MFSGGIVAARKAVLTFTRPLCSANGSDGASLRGDARMTQCLRVATCVLREAIPSSSTSHRRKQR